MVAWTRLLIAIAFVVPCLGTAFGADFLPDPNRRIVTFDSSVSAGARVEIAERIGWTVLKELDLIHGLAVTLDEKKLVKETRAGRQVDVWISELQLRSTAGVLSVEKDLYQIWIEAAPAQPLDAALPDLSRVPQEAPFPSVTDILMESRAKGPRLPIIQEVKPVLGPDPEIPWGVARVNAPKAWPVTMADGVKVAIVDTGIDMTHPDLKVNIAGGVNATDRNKEKDFNDDHGHGTWVAGVAAAVRDNTGVAGVGPKIKLYGVKVLNAQGGGYLSDIIWGLSWCINNKVNVLNMSFGTTQDIRQFRMAIVMVYEAGVTLVAAAGNQGRDGGTGKVTFPGGYDIVLTASASDQNDKFAAFSSFGKAVDFIAPGVSILSTIKGGGHRAFSGTSGSCPHLAGLAAIAISRGAKTPQQVETALIKAAEPLAGLTKEQQGNGIINAEKLVK